MLLYLLVAFRESFAYLVNRVGFPLWRIPLVRSKLLLMMQRLDELLRFYAARRPPGALASVFSVFRLADPDARKEWKLFGAIADLGVLFLLFTFGTWIYEYFTLYRPQLTLYNLLIDVKLTMIVVSAFAVFLWVVPIVRTLCYLEISGHRATNRKLVVAAIAAIAAMPYLTVQESYSYEDYARLKIRLAASKEFKKAVNERVGVFLAVNFRTLDFTGTVADDGARKPLVKVADSRLALADSIRLTRRLRRGLVAGGIAHRSEVNGFRVLAFQVRYPSVKGKERWGRALLVYTGYGTGGDDEERRGAPVDNWDMMKTTGMKALEIMKRARVRTLWRILETRLATQGKGDQLSPGYEG